MLARKSQTYVDYFQGVVGRPVGYTFPTNNRHGDIQEMASNLGVSTAEFKDKVLGSEVPVLVDFWAEWCGPCKAIGPAIEQLAGEVDGKAKVYKVDVDSDPDLASEYGVMSIPAVFVFKGGKVVDQQIGMASKEKYADMLARAM